MRSNFMILFAMVAVIGLLTSSAQAFHLKVNGTTIFVDGGITASL